MSFENPHRIEFRPGESTEDKIKQEEERNQAELERTRGFTDADHAEDMLASMLESQSEYSETFKIKPDGNLDKINRLDGSPVYLGFGDTSEELMQMAQEIQNKHPEYQFNFENDPEGQWVKYTVSKSEKPKIEDGSTEIPLESLKESSTAENDIEKGESIENNIDQSDKLREERRTAIMRELEKAWEDKNGPMDIPMTESEIEQSKFITERDGRKWDDRKTKLTEKARNFWFGFDGGGSIPEKADRILAERFPEYKKKK